MFLDDLGINLKPARAMGMTTIKVLTARQAIDDLEAVLSIPLDSTRITAIGGGRWRRTGGNGPLS